LGTVDGVSSLAFELSGP
jgi:hypothetical protein